MFKVRKVSPYAYSRPKDSAVVTPLCRTTAFNRHSTNEGTYVSPYDQGFVDVGLDHIKVTLVQGLNEEMLKKTMSIATRAAVGLDMAAVHEDDYKDMFKGGLQSIMESQVVIFAVEGITRTCTHQLVRTRKAAFHQQSMRPSFMGVQPNTRVPESIWNNERARIAFLRAMEASHEAYRIAAEEDIAYQDCREVLLEGTETSILCEYPLREFINTYQYRACSMFNHQIVQVFREMGRLLVEASWNH